MLLREKPIWLIRWIVQSCGDNKKEKRYHWPVAHTGATRGRIFLRQWKNCLCMIDSKQLASLHDFNVAGAPDLEEGFILNYK